MINEEKYVKIFDDISEQLKNMEVSKREISDSSKKLNKISEVIDRYTQLGEVWKSRLVNLSISKEFQTYLQIVKDSEGLSEKEFEEKFSAELKQSKKLGSHGWIPSEYGNPKDISEWADYVDECPEKIMDFFEGDNKNILNKIIDTLSCVYVDIPYKRYYEKGLRYFYMKDYMTAAMYWTILMEIRISNLVEFPGHGQKQKRLTYDDKYSEYGFSLQREKTYQKKKDFQTKRFYFLNFYPALQEYVHRLFAYGYLTFDITDISQKEPDYLDRTWLLHGRCCRETTRMDCIQLLNALDVCEYIFNK